MRICAENAAGKGCFLFDSDFGRMENADTETPFMVSS